MKRKDSIQETLVDHYGFTIKGDTFVKDGYMGEISIPFNEVIGHTVGSFLEKAKRRGWLQEESAAPLSLPGMII
jgi:hypothetical protein